MNKIFNNTLVQQILFWSISFLILYRLFSREGDNGLTDIYYTILFHLPLVFVVYGNYYLVDLFIIKQRKISHYVLGLGSILAVGVGFHYLSYNVLSDWLFPGYYFVSFYTIREVLEFVGSYAIISMLLLLSKNWFLLKEKQLALEKENHQVKLAALKGQINPHFLFNNLNNIYGIIPSENELGRKYLLKLSDALRYMIYDTAEDLVPLEREIAYVKNYVDLEQLRMDEEATIQLQINGDFSGYLIAPLLLLPLVENCFKHYNNTVPNITIQINLADEMLQMTTNNTRETRKINEKSGGLGLTNLKKRLHLIYPNKHQLTANETKTHYECNLQINLQP